MAVYYTKNLAVLTLAFSCQHPHTFYLPVNINYRLHRVIIWSALKQKFIAYFLNSLHCLQEKEWKNLRLTAEWVSPWCVSSEGLLWMAFCIISCIKPCWKTFLCYITIKFWFWTTHLQNLETFETGASFVNFNFGALKFDGYICCYQYPLQIPPPPIHLHPRHLRQRRLHSIPCSVKIPIV